jgi:hypothetical protein
VSQGLQASQWAKAARSRAFQASEIETQRPRTNQFPGAGDPASRVSFSPCRRRLSGPGSCHRLQRLCLRWRSIHLLTTRPSPNIRHPEIQSTYRPQSHHLVSPMREVKAVVASCPCLYRHPRRSAGLESVRSSSERVTAGSFRAILGFRLVSLEAWV